METPLSDPGRWLTRPALAFLAVVLAVSLAAIGLARADIEPNDFLYQAQGPLTGGTVHSGTLNTINEDDWYVFYASSQTQLDIAFLVAADGCYVNAELLDTNGEYVTDEYPDEGVPTHLRYTTPVGVSRFFLRVATGGNCYPNHYSFSLNPGPAIIGGTPMPASELTGEPNEFRTQAVGPLLGDRSYAGTTDTSNDVDWFYFYANGHPFDLSVTGKREDGCSAGMELYEDGSQDLVDATSWEENTIRHLALTPPGFRKYLIRMDTPCIGSAYDLRITPSSALAETPVGQGPSASCRSAKEQRNILKAKLSRLHKKIRHASSKRIKRQIERKYNSTYRGWKAAKQDVSRFC